MRNLLLTTKKERNNRHGLNEIKRINNVADHKEAVRILRLRPPKPMPAAGVCWRVASCDQSSTQLSIFFSDFLIAVGTPLFWLEMKTLAWFPIGSSELRSAKTILILTQVFFVHSKAGLCASAPCLWWWNGVLWFVKRIKLVLTFSFLGQGCLGFDLELKWRF